MKQCQNYIPKLFCLVGLSASGKSTIGKQIAEENDCVIISASPIPGNEKSVYKVINNLYKKGSEVIYHELADVHVSGHACQEELKIVHSLINPKFFIPVHGEYRHLKIHQDLAISLGIPARNTLIADIGNVVELGTNSMIKVKDVTSGNRLIDGLGIGDLESVVLRDRKQLSIDGVCVVSLSYDAGGHIYREPDILSRGFIYNEEQNEVIHEARKVLFEALQNENLKKLDKVTIKTNVKKILTNFFSKKVKRKPLIITLV